MRGVVFGDIGVNSEIESPDPCGGSVPTAGALVLTFLLNNYQDPEYQELAEKWEKEVSERTNSGRTSISTRSTVHVFYPFMLSPAYHRITAFFPT